MDKREGVREREGTQESENDSAHVLTHTRRTATRERGREPESERGNKTKRARASEMLCLYHCMNILESSLAKKSCAILQYFGAKFLQKMPMTRMSLHILSMLVFPAWATGGTGVFEDSSRTPPPPPTAGTKLFLLRHTERIDFADKTWVCVAP